MSPSSLRPPANPSGLLCALFMIASSAVAQTVLSPLPASRVVPVNDPSKPAPKGAAPQSSILSAYEAGLPLVQWGPFAVRPHFVYRFMYADGLLNAGQQESGNSLVHSISPGVLVEIGRHWTADYSMTRNIYSNEFITDNTGHSFNLAGGYTFGEWRAGVSQIYNADSPTLVETGSQTRQKSYSTEGTLSRTIGARTLVNFSVSRQARYANASASAPQWTTADWLSWSSTESVHYYLTRELDLAGSFSFGYDDVSNGADMSYTRPEVQLTWRPVTRLSVSAQYGREIRHFRVANSESLTSPVYSGSLRYQAFETTALTLTANRRLSASYFANQATKDDAVGIAVDQRLLQRIFATVSASQYQTHYYASGTGVRTGRTDKGSALQARLSTAILKRGSASVFYQVAHNRSNSIGFGFNSHQVGTEFAYRF